MNLALKISLTASGVYLLAGMLIGIIKYRKTMQSAEHRAPAYIDIAHRAAFLYSFAALTIAKLLEQNALSDSILFPATTSILIFFSLTIIGYLITGLKDETDNLFREKNFLTTWFMYGLIAAEIGGFIIILGGFLIRIFN